MAGDAERSLHAPTTGCRWRAIRATRSRQPRGRPPISRCQTAQPQLPDMRGRRRRPFEQPPFVRAAHGHRGLTFSFAAAPTEGLRSADKAHSTQMVAPARRDSHVREAWAHLARVRAPLGAPHGGFWRRPALHLRRCRRIRRACCARPGVVPGERGPKPPEPAISAAVQDATPAPSSGSSPETPLVEQDGRLIGHIRFVVNRYLRIVFEKYRRVGSRMIGATGVRPHQVSRYRAARCASQTRRGARPRRSAGGGS